MAAAKKDVKAETIKEKKVTKKVNAPVKEGIAMDNSVIEMLMKQIADLQSRLDEKESKEVEAVKEQPIKKEKKTRVSLDNIRGEEVEVQRVVGGIGIVKYIDSKTGDEFTWREKNSIEYLTVDQVRRMNNKSSLYLKAPWVKILDNEILIDALNLRELYQNINLINDKNALVDIAEDKLKNIVDSLSTEYKNILATNISEMIGKEDIVNINAIKKFERVLEKEFVK